MITRYGGELEADFARYYRIDLRDMYRRRQQPPHPLTTVTRRPAAPYVIGTAGGLLAALLITAPGLAAALLVVAVLAVPIAWHALTPTPRTGYTLTPRRVLELTKHLPHDSATIAAMRGGPEFRGWTADRYLFALIGDLLQNLIYVQVARANPRRKPPRPAPIPRPDDAKPTPAAGSFRSTALEHLRRAHNAKG